MFKRLFFSLLFVLLTAVVVFGAAEPALNVALVWHQHQPLYFDPAAAELMLPWVRMHAIKDYYDMAAVLKNYPDLKVTFNLVPILLEQLALYESGELIDRYQIHAQTEAADLTEAEKEFLLQRFFDANWDNVIARFPRYLELLEKRGTQADKKAIGEAMQRFTEQDYLDLQVWFNLAWFDPDFLQDDPKLAALVQRGRNFTEADKAVIHSKQVEIINEVVDVHRRLQQAGQIEIITTPYAHPILPLLYDTDLASVASPDLPLPEPAFAYPEDIKRLGLVIGEG
ncbi:MAG TPA: glycoside hydrolase family 57, partial [Firmicutes bacterium]|nr:glycoside hydrolase family 57 [Bacillota bacterium]